MKKKSSPFALGSGPSKTLTLKFFATDLKLIFNCTWEIFTPAGILHCVFSPMFVPSLVYLTVPVLSLNCTSYLTKQFPDAILFHFTETQPVEGFPACGFGKELRFAAIHVHFMSMVLLKNPNVIKNILNI